MGRTLKGWRTILWNVANAVLLSMEVAESQYSIPDGYMEIWFAVYIAVNILLRLVTTSPVGGKQ